MVFGRIGRIAKAYLSWRRYHEIVARWYRSSVPTAMVLPIHARAIEQEAGIAPLVSQFTVAEQILAAHTRCVAR